MGRLTTHVLDQAAGKPAAGLRIEVWRLDGASALLKTVTTNSDGRIDGPLLEGEALTAGHYELRFHAGDYLRCLGGEAARSGVPRRDSDPLRHCRPRRALSRAAAALALWLFDLSGKLMADADAPSASCAGARWSSSPTSRPCARCSTICGSRNAPAAPRKAAARAIAAPARWRSARCATAASSMSRSMPASCSSARSTARRWSTVDDLAPRGRPASGAAGDGRPSRLAMRLLHAGLRHEPVHALPRRGARRPGRGRTTGIAGNLCRCTGYRPIVDAALTACAGAARPMPMRAAAETARSSAAARRRRGSSSSATSSRFFAAPASAESLAELYAAPSRCDDRRRRDRCRPVDHQAASRPAQDHPSRPRRGSAPTSPTTATRCPSAPPSPMPRPQPIAGGDRSRSRRAAPPPRLEAGAGHRHGRRQHRQWLADRRHAAGADRARRHARAAPRRRHAHAAARRFLHRLWQAGSRGRANSCRRIDGPEARGRTKPSAATRSPSASTRISRPVMGAFRLTLDGGRIARRPYRLRRHGGDAEARRSARKRRCTALDLTMQPAGTPALAALDRGFPADRRPPRSRSLSPGDGARAADARRCTRSPARDSAATRIIGQREVRHDASPEAQGTPRSPRRPPPAWRRALAHDSAARHVQGAAIYIDDMREPEGTLHVAPGYAAEGACGRIATLDLEAVRAAPGVVAVLTADDIPGINDCSPAHRRRSHPRRRRDRVPRPGDLRGGRRNPRRRRAARRGWRGSRSPPKRRRSPSTTRSPRTRDVLPPYEFMRGDVGSRPRRARHRHRRQAFRIGGQEHFYLEGQVALAMPRGGRRHDWSIPRPSIRPRCSIASPRCWRCPMPW